MLLSKIKARILASLVPMACLGFIAYLGYHSLYGDSGVLRYFQLQQQKERLHYELSLVQAERHKLERRVVNLRDDPLDLDLLDERARRVLGYTYPGELVIHNPHQLLSQTDLE